jgi:hypothetical protein
VSFIAARNPIVRRVGFAGTLVLAVFDLFAVLVTVPAGVFFLLTGYWFLMLVGFGNLVVLGVLFARTRRRWSEHGRHALAELIWDVALLQVVMLPFAVIASIL